METSPVQQMASNSKNHSEPPITAEEEGEQTADLSQIRPPKHPSFEDAMVAWRDATSQQGKALAEERLWQMADFDTRQKYRRRDWLSVLTGASAYETDVRGRIAHGPQSLWDRVDSPDDPLPSGTAIKLFRQAKARMKKERGMTLERAMESELADYDALPVFHTAAGKTFRRRVGSQRMQQKTKLALDGAQGRGWWARMRQVIGNIVADRVPENVDDLVRTDLYNWLNREITSVIEQFTGMAASAQRRNAPDVNINRKNLVAACQILHIDPPRPGASINIDRAREAKKKLSREYHPDANKGNENMRDLYEAVIQAAIVIEAYATRYGSTSAKREDRSSRSIERTKKEKPHDPGSDEPS
jgi:hypothetical protein